MSINGNTLRDHAFPVIGSRPISEIGTPDVLTVLSPIWLTKPETLRLVHNAYRLDLEGRSMRKPEADETVRPSTVV